MSTTETRPGVQAPVESLEVSTFTVPTEEPESDGTAEWDSTTIVVVEARAGEQTGLGYTYAPAAAGKLVDEKLGELCGAATRSQWRSAGRRWRSHCAMPAGPGSASARCPRSTSRSGT